MINKKIKNLILSTLLTFTSFSLFAAENFSFSLEPVIGIKNGYIYEYVFSNNSKTGKEYKLSQLDWNMKKTFFYGIHGDIKKDKSLISIEFKTIAPGVHGKMKDYDWAQDYGYKTGNSDLLTNYSEHDNELLKGINLSLFTKRPFSLSSSFKITPGIGLTFEYYSFDGKNGFSQYGNPRSPGQESSYYEYNDPTNSYRNNFSGTVISLERKDIYTWLGLDIEFSLLNNKIKFLIGAYVSPYTYLYAFDSHYLRTPRLYFKDISQGFFSSYKGNVSIAFTPNDFFGLKFSVSGLITKEIHGTEEYTSGSPDNSYIYVGEGIGAGTKYLDLSLSCTFIF